MLQGYYVTGLVSLLIGWLLLTYLAFSELLYIPGKLFCIQRHDARVPNFTVFSKMIIVEMTKSICIHGRNISIK